MGSVQYHSPLILVMNMNQTEILELAKVMAFEVDKAIMKRNTEISNDRTYDGIITSALGNNKYMILILNEYYEVYSNSDIQYVAGDKVWVTAPCNDKSKQFISGRRR